MNLLCSGPRSHSLLSSLCVPFYATCVTLRNNTTDYGRPFGLLGVDREDVDYVLPVFLPGVQLCRVSSLFLPHLPRRSEGGKRENCSRFKTGYSSIMMKWTSTVGGGESLKSPSRHHTIRPVTFCLTTGSLSLPRSVFFLFIFVTKFLRPFHVFQTRRIIPSVVWRLLCCPLSTLFPWRPVSFVHWPPLLTSSIPHVWSRPFFCQDDSITQVRR